MSQGYENSRGLFGGNGTALLRGLGGGGMSVVELALLFE